MSLNGYSDNDIDSIVWSLNATPRKWLAFKHLFRHKVDGWQTLSAKIVDGAPGLDPRIELAA